MGLPPPPDPAGRYHPPMPGPVHTFYAIAFLENLSLRELLEVAVVLLIVLAVVLSLLHFR